MDVAGRILLGIVVGTIGTLVGTGGGWALVPIFMLGFNFAPQDAAATSLAVVFLNALSGTVAYAFQKRIQYRTAMLFSVATIPGAVLGTHVAPMLDAATFTRAFSLFLLLVSGTLLLKKRAPESVSPSTASVRLPLSSLALGMVVSLFVGVVSSVLGVGGGIIHVPFLVLVLGMGAHLATATSHFVLMVTSATGVVGYALEGHVQWTEALTVGGGAVVGAQLGARLSKVLPGLTIQRVLAVLLVAFALSLLWRTR